MLKNGLHYIYAEYCPGDFFWGWWLYGAPIVDEKPDRKHYTWLHADYWISVLYRALNLPTQLDYRHTPYVETFLAHYPNGALVNVASYYDWARQDSDLLWDYLRQVREGQLLDWKHTLVEVEVKKKVSK